MKWYAVLRHAMLRHAGGPPFYRCRCGIASAARAARARLGAGHGAGAGRGSGTNVPVTDDQWAASLQEMLTKVGLSSPHLGCPHLVTTGADAELNSFASNVRLCTLSFTATPTLATPTPTRCCTTTNASLLHPDDAIAVQSPACSDVVTPTSNRVASPSPAKASSSPTTPTPPSRTLRVPASPGHAGHAASLPYAASHTTVITLAQTVIELRVPVQVPNATSTSLSKVHHV